MTPEPRRAVGICIRAESATRPVVTAEQAAAIGLVFRLMAIGWFLGRTKGFDFSTIPTELAYTLLDEREQ